MRFILPLLCVAALSITVRGQASPVEIKRGSPAQQFIDAAQRIAGDGTSKVLKDAAQYLNPHIASEKGRGVAPGSNLASSSFASSNAGWSVTTSDGVVSDAQVSGGSITAKFAQGGRTLYFTSPASWPSDVSGAYNGKLSFMTNPAEYTGSFISATGYQSNPSGSSLYDVALVAQCGYALTYSGLFTATSSSSYSVTLNEDSGWVDSRTGRRPTMFDFLGTLSNLKSVQIRAYAYSGPGTGALYSASVQAGIKWNPCCTTDDTVDICANPGSPYYNPPQLRFYCAGSQAFVTRVTSVSPKFARQTGGATITVYGENFGYPGSPATVRIGGLACQQTSYTSDTITTGNLGPVNHNRLVCTTPVSRGFDHSVTVTAQSSSLASPYSVRENALRTRWEYLGTDATSCSSDDTHGFQFGAHDFSLVTELTNLVGGSDIHVATDYNTGDVYAFGKIKSGQNFETLGKHISLGDKNTLTAPGHDFSAFLLKSNKQGVPQWVAHITGAELTALQPAGVQVDASTSPPSIYIAASIAASAVTSPTFCTGKYVANSLANANCDALLKRRPDASAAPTAGHVKAFLAKYTGSGAVSWASPILHTAGTFELSLSAFRPSTSRIINYQTQSDNPSAIPVKPYLKDNGGVFLAGTIATAGTVTFGYESQIYSSVPNSATGETSAFTHTAALAGFVTKYDDDGRVLWARLFTGANAGLATALPANSKVTDVSAMNDRVYVVGFQAGAVYFQSCQFRTHSGGSGDTLSENRECLADAANSASLASGGVAGVFAVAYDASGQVQWIKNYPSAAATVAACTAVSSLKTARPLTGNTVAWNNLQTLLGRNQPVFGEPNDVGSEFREVGAAAGRWLYIVGSYSGTTTTIELPQNLAYSPIMAQGSFTSAKEPAFPIVSAGTAITLTAAAGSTTAFLIKVDAATGLTQWGSKYVAANWAVVPTDVAADPVTGNVYIAGTVTNPSTVVTPNCNGNADANCGVDLFNMGIVRKVGCPQDPRPVLSIKQCPVDHATESSRTCTYGILNKERGLPYCRFVPLKMAASSTSGFVAAISEVWTDEFGRTVAIGYSSDTTAGITNVAWFKVLGNGHGHNQASGPAAIATSTGSKLALHDTDVIVSGFYSGHPITAAVTATNPPLQFPGVHALYQDNVLLPAAQQTNEGLSSSASGGVGGFVAWLVD